MLPETIKRLLACGLVDRCEVQGWVRSVRVQKHVAFANITDGSQVSGLQAILKPEMAKRLTTGACVRLTGSLQKSPGKGQSTELQVEQVQILGECDPETYPMQKKHQSVEFLRENMHLRTRANVGAAMMRLRSAAVDAFHDFFRKQEFQLVHTPILTSHDCEGGGEVFKVQPAHQTSTMKPSEFFGKPVYLTVSGQLHAEIMASALSRVYTFGPIFRAEESLTSRHLAEFWMLEAEVAFIDKLDQLTQLAEATLRQSISSILESSSEDLHFIQKYLDTNVIDQLHSTVAKPFEKITYTEAIDILTAAQTNRKATFDFPVQWGSSLQSEHEKYLATTYFNHPVFVTDYPKAIKPFYMQVNESNPDRETVACTDLLVPHLGELIGGSMRESRFDILQHQMQHHRIDPKEYEWYLDLRKWGSFPHGGFGIGFERFLLYLTGMESIRDVIPMPRWVNNCKF